MKNLFLIILVFVFLTGAVMAQDFHFSEAKIYSGKSALSSGVGGVIAFADTTMGSAVMVEVNSTMGQVIFTKTKGGYTYGPTFGQQYNAFWVAPIFTFSPWKFVSFTSWNGIFLGKPDHPGWNPNFAFGYQAVDFSYKRFGWGYALLHYMQSKPMSLPYVKYVIPAGDKAGVTVSYTYEINSGKPMFLVSGGYQIN